MERLQELKNEVAAQEMKLKSLQLKRQQQQCTISATNGTTEQEAMSSLIFLKEKELAFALMKVAELTGQLEKLKRTEAKSESPSRTVERISAPRRTVSAPAVEDKLEERQESVVSVLTNHALESNGAKTAISCQGNNEKMKPSRSFDVSMATQRGRSSMRDQFFSSSFSNPSSSLVVSRVSPSNGSLTSTSCIVSSPSLTSSISQVPRDRQDFSNKLRHSTSSSIMSKFAPKPYPSRSLSVDCGLTRRPLLSNTHVYSQDDTEMSGDGPEPKSILGSKAPNVCLLPKSASFHYGYNEKENALIRARRSDGQHGDVKTTSTQNVIQPNDSMQNPSVVLKPKITPKPVHLLKDSKPASSIKENNNISIYSCLNSTPPPEPPKRKGRTPSAISTVPVVMASTQSNDLIEIPCLRNNLTITLSRDPKLTDPFSRLHSTGHTIYSEGIGDKSSDESEVFKKGGVRELSRMFSQLPKEGSPSTLTSRDSTHRHAYDKIEKSVVDKSAEPKVSTAIPSNECLQSSKDETNQLLPVIDISANAVSSALSILLSGNSRQTTASRPNRLFGYSASFSRPKFSFVPSSQKADPTHVEKDGDNIPLQSETSDGEIVRSAPKAPTIYSLFSPPPKARLSTSSTASPENYPRMNDLGISETKSATKKNIHLPRLSYITLSSDLAQDNKEEGTPPSKVKSKKRVTIDPTFLFLSTAVEGELDVIKSVISQVPDPDLSNDNGMTALHVAVCNDHADVVRFLLDYGCNVNAPNCECWTPLHYAALGNKRQIAEMLLTSGASVFALTASDHETPAQKCQSKLHHYQECLKLLEDFGNELGRANEGVVYSAADYTAECENECSFKEGEMLRILRRGDEEESEWWWASRCCGGLTLEGYVPRSILSLHPKQPKIWRNK